MLSIVVSTHYVCCAHGCIGNNMLNAWIQVSMSTETHSYYKEHMRRQRLSLLETVTGPRWQRQLLCGYFSKWSQSTLLCQWEYLYIQWPLTCVSATMYSSGFKWTVKASRISLCPSYRTWTSTTCSVSPSLNSTSTHTYSHKHDIWPKTNKMYNRSSVKGCL